MKTKNFEIKKALLMADLHMWNLAEMLHVSEATVLRWLRNELPEELQQKIVRMIETKDVSNRCEITEEIRKCVLINPNKRKKNVPYEYYALLNEKNAIDNEDSFSKLFLET